jgi:hypothetical protein
MSQPTQIIFGTPNNDWNAIDNSAAPSFPTLNSGSGLGYDTVAPGSVPAGAVAQATNPYGDTGSTTLDSVNDTFYADPSCATFAGNPVAMTAPTFAKVTTVLNNATTGIRILYKNPA